MRRPVRLFILLVSVFAAYCSSTGSGRSGAVKQYTPGCQVTVNQTTASALYEPIIVLGAKEGIDENGNPIQEYWVWYPQRPKEDYVDMNGDFRAVNVPKYKILLMSEARIINGVLCKCPD